MGLGEHYKSGFGTRPCSRWDHVLCVPITVLNLLILTDTECNRSTHGLLQRGLWPPAEQGTALPKAPTPPILQAESRKE